MNKNFFEAWEKESESTLIFLQENGQAISADGTKMRIDMPSKLLLDLKNGYNIGKLVRLDYDQKKKDGYLVAIPCQEYTINGETYTAIGTVYDHSKLDSMLKLKGYDGKAYLFMLDHDGNITVSYTHLAFVTSAASSIELIPYSASLARICFSLLSYDSNKAIFLSS